MTTLQELIEAGYSAGKAAEALGITRGSACGRARRLGLRFHGADNGATRFARANQFTADDHRARDAALKLAAQREREAAREAKAEAARKLDRKPGRLCALLAGMLD